MQKKIDYCFDELEKPLGVSVCAKWEVPRPFMSKSFPFVKGVGNMELAIKKTDVGMRSYEMSVEIPKHKVRYFLSNHFLIRHKDKKYYYFFK